MNSIKPKIALVFDWLTTSGGAEKVNLQLHRMFPDAPIFTSIYNPDRVQGFENATIHTSFLQKLPFAKTRHQFYLSLMPQAYENFDLSGFDIVISSSHSCAKGVITKPETLHVSYCHSPMRYAWGDWQQYFSEYKMNPLVKFFGKRQIHNIRIWDRLSADRVDDFIANSTTTAQRIQKYYRKPSEIIHPPIDINDYNIATRVGDYYLTVGRLIPYKRFDLTIQAFKKLKLPLKIVGTGVAEKELQALAGDSSNIEFLGHVPDSDLKELYLNSKALIFPQLEDFGITPLESMASGRPVIAYGAGGALDTIIDGQTGILFPEQTLQSLIHAIETFERTHKNFSPEKIRSRANTFHKDQFEKKFHEYIESKMKSKASRQSIQLPTPPTLSPSQVNHF